MSGLRVVEPTEICDRCGHESRRHAMPIDGSVCTVAETHPVPKAYLAGAKAKRCMCDGFFPKARSV